MRQFIVWAGLACALSCCATEHDVPAAVAGPLDSAFRGASLPAGKIKFSGPVTLQIGGANNTATTTAIAKSKAPVASAPHATATATTTKAGPPWWVYAGGAALLLLAGWLLRSKWG